MPITHATHATPISKADYEADHVGDGGFVLATADPTGATQHSARTILLNQISDRLWFNVGTFASPDWHYLKQLSNSAGGFGWGGAEAGVSGPVFVISTGSSPTGTDVFTGAADPSAGAGYVANVIPSIYIRRNDTGATPITELWIKVGTADTDWVKASLGGTPQTYAESNVTTDRTYDANATTVAELADVLGTLIADLRDRGVVL